MRQVSLGEQIGDGPWVEELLDGRLAALMAHLAQPTRTSHHQGHQKDIIVIHCSDEQQEEILPDSFVDSLRRHTTSEQMTEPSHVTHEMRPILICQVCGEFYGEEQLKFYQHLKQHYEPQASIIIENPIVPDIAMDKYSMALDKEVPPDMDDTLDKLELYCCVKCNKSFRKQKQCEMHIKEVHSNPKVVKKSPHLILICRPYLKTKRGRHSDPDLTRVRQSQRRVYRKRANMSLLFRLLQISKPPTKSPRQHRYPSCCENPGIDSPELFIYTISHRYSRTGAESPSGAMSMCACGGGGYCDVCAPPSLQPDHSLQSAPSHIHPHSQSLTIQTSHANTQPHNIEHTHTQPENAHPSHSHVHEHISSSTTHLQPSHSHTQSSQLHPSQPHSQQLQVTSPRQSPPPSPPRMKGCQVMVTRDFIIYQKSEEASKIFNYDSMICGLLYQSPFKSMKIIPNDILNKIHVRAHEGVKPCVCTVCGQHFRQSSDLKYHIASKHSTTCPHCDKCFRVAYDMRRHVRVVHEKHKPPQIKQEKELEDRTKQKPAKRSKKPPNVTVQNTSGEFKEFDGEIFKYKFKEVYPEPEKPDAKDKRLRSDSERIVFRDNTDGKMPVFSQIEKPSYSVSNLVTISDIKSLEVSRERDADCVENGFFDKLAFYNISAV
ncbi:unnamed protein product [Leptidea sinapis]|uniref:C2H2-type domain-containing protein n=1 Tax=Leptidea sinapis TaxID=189913 RepID=A0A5E4Q294_9NEOP|nr:unnamed protein product [Leptidea sinapis]